MAGVKGKTNNPNGRPPGTLNKATLEFKEAVVNLLNHASPHMIEWLESIVYGKKEQILVLKGDVEEWVDGDTWLIEPNPEKAFDIISKLGEYAFPKLARTEIKNAPGETFKTEAVGETDKEIIQRYLSQTPEQGKVVH